MLLSDVSDIDIPVPAASVTDGWLIGIYTGVSGVDHLLGRVSDNGNEYEDWDAYAESWVRVNIASVEGAVAIPAGYRIDVTSTGGAKHIWLPAVTGDTYYYAGLDGSTYVDRWLCQTAYDAAVKTPTPSPSVTPSPSTTPTPQPCEGRDWMKADEVASDFTIKHPRSSAVNGWAYNLRRGDHTDYAFHSPWPADNWTPPAADNHSLATVWDKQNIISTHGSYASALPVVIYYNYVSTPITITAGDYITANFGGNDKLLYLPSGTFTADTAFWYDSDGAAYYDQWLCNVAKAVPTATANPSPTPSPSPYVGLSLEYTEIPLTEEQTSIYDVLNTTFEEIAAAVNHVFDNLLVSYGQLGANVVDNTAMRDYAIDNMNIQTGAVDSRTILNSSIEYWDIQSTATHDNTFDIRNQITFTMNSSPDTNSFRWSVKNPTANEQSSNACNLYLTATADDGTTTWPIVANRNSGYVGFNGVTQASAGVDVGGGLRVRGTLTLDKGFGSPWVQFADQSSIPSARNGVNFYHKNTAQTTITGISGNVDGNHIWVLALDASTRFSAESTSKVRVAWNLCSAPDSSWAFDTWGEVAGWRSDTDTLSEWVKFGDQWKMASTSNPHARSIAGGGVDSIVISDDFSSGDFAGGDGWSAGEWTVDDAVIRDGWARIGSNGYIQRLANVTGITAAKTLTFNFKASSTFSGQSIKAQISADASTWTTVTEITAGGTDVVAASDSVAIASKPYVQFIFTGSGVYVYIDDVKVE